MLGVHQVRGDFPGHGNLWLGSFCLPLTNEMFNPLQHRDIEWECRGPASSAFLMSASKRSGARDIRFEELLLVAL